jgi:hypothetical protein
MIKIYSVEEWQKVAASAIEKENLNGKFGITSAISALRDQEMSYDEFKYRCENCDHEALKVQGSKAGVLDVLNSVSIEGISFEAHEKSAPVASPEKESPRIVGIIPKAEEAPAVVAEVRHKDRDKLVVIIDLANKGSKFFADVLEVVNRFPRLSLTAIMYVGAEKNKWAHVYSVPEWPTKCRSFDKEKAIELCTWLSDWMTNTNTKSLKDFIFMAIAEAYEEMSYAEYIEAFLKVPKLDKDAKKADVRLALGLPKKKPAKGEKVAAEPEQVLEPVGVAAAE